MFFFAENAFSGFGGENAYFKFSRDNAFLGFWRKMGFRVSEEKHMFWFGGKTCFRFRRKIYNFQIKNNNII